MSLFRSLFKGSAQKPKATSPVQETKIAPLADVAPHYIIGDVHGRFDLLTALVSKIAEDRNARPNMATAPIVLVGDYIDRGDQSAQVLAALFEEAQSPASDTVFLKGNHEAMLLSFLDAPREKGARWLHYGGLQTLASFGIGGLSERASPDELVAARAELRTELPKGMEAWLRAMPTLYRPERGNLCVVHAALDPAAPPELSDERMRLWGHRAFLKEARTDGLWVAHGHTIVPEAACAQGRIAVDTGAFATGRLTAAGVAGSESWFLTT